LARHRRRQRRLYLRRHSRLPHQPLPVPRPRAAPPRPAAAAVRRRPRTGRGVLLAVAAVGGGTPLLPRYPRQGTDEDRAATLCTGELARHATGDVAVHQRRPGAGRRRFAGRPAVVAGGAVAGAARRRAAGGAPAAALARPHRRRFLTAGPLPCPPPGGANDSGSRPTPGGRRGCGGTPMVNKIT